MLTPTHSMKEEVFPTPEEYQAQFYENYRKAAEEYDKEFLKKHEEYLNTTPNFVSYQWRPEERVLIKLPGWTVLRRFWGYHPSQLSPQARSQ